MGISYDFQGRHAVVTGAASGIGFAIAEQLLAAGARVSLWDYAAEALAATAARLARYQDHMQTLQVDVGDPEACAAAAARLPFTLHILVNNAGITRDKSISKLSIDDFAAVIRTNLTGSFLVTKTLLPQFDQGSSEKRIINMASIVALYGNFGQTNYAAAKAGVIGMTKTLARELGPKGFTVNAIAPGFVDTPMVAAMPKEARESVAAKVPRGRLGSPLDIARACLFLAAEENGYINGAVLSVDGGLVV